MRVEITVKSESTEQSRVTLDERTKAIVIGRHGTCELQSLSPSVSRRHAELTWDGSRLVIKDLQSTAGTYVNDRRVEHAEVGLGDEVRCGQVQLAVKFVGHGSEGNRKAQGNTMVLETYAPKDKIVHRQTASPELSAAERTQREQNATLKPGDVSESDVAHLQSLVADQPSPSPQGVVDPQADVTLPTPINSRATGPEPAPAVQRPRPSSAPPAQATLGRGRDAALSRSPAVKRQSAPRHQQGSQPVMGYGLQYTETDGETQTIFVPMDASGFVIGRGRQAAGLVRHSTVSRKHCELTCNGSSLYVRDLGSSTGTRINGQRVRDGQLQEGDILTLGKLELTMGMHFLEQRSEEDEKDGPWALNFADGDGVIHTFHVEEDQPPLVLGRSKQADITLPATTIGRKHCEIRLSGDRLFVKDLQSRNGTFVNDRRIREKSLKPGDVIKCGAFPIEVVGPQHQGAILGWEDGWDDEWTDEDMAPPIWHIIYVGDEGQVEHESLGPRQRVLAIGSDTACQIQSSTHGLDPDHCEITWEEGTPIAKDLESSTGTSLRGQRIEERVLKNADTLTCGSLTLHIIRGRTRRVPDHASTHPIAVKEWSENFKLKDSSCCLVYSYGDEDDPSFESIGKTELTVWVDGEAAAERTTTNGSVKSTGTIQPSTVDLLLSSLRRAGYPVVNHPYEPEEGCPVELAAYQGDEEVSVLLGRHAMNRSEDYREAVELLRAFAFELVATAESAPKHEDEPSSASPS